MPQIRNWYEEYLRSDHWRCIRQAVLERANHRCERCGGDICLDVHHKTYDRLGSELPEDLEVLCEDCHTAYHDIELEESQRFARRQMDYRRIFVAAYGNWPHLCYFCDEIILKPGQRRRQGVVHHLDGDQSNNSPSNLVAAHTDCHSRYHSLMRWADPDLRYRACARMSATRKRLWEEPDFRTSGLAQLATMHAKWMKKIANPTYRSTFGANSKELWTNPDYREKQRVSRKASWNNPQRRVDQSRRSKALWADPEFRTRTTISMSEKAKVAWKIHPRAPLVCSYCEREIRGGRGNLAQHENACRSRIEANALRALRGNSISLDHRLKISVANRGSGNPSAKLTEAAVHEIRQLIGTRTLASIARQFGVSIHAVRRIRDREAWTHVL